MDFFFNKNKETKKIKIKNIKSKIIIAFLLITSILPIFYYYSFNDNNYIKENPNIFTFNSYNFTNSYLFKSPWNTPSFQTKSFVFEVEIGPFVNGSNIYNEMINTIEHYNLGTGEWFKENTTEWGEWGYAFHHLLNGQLDGMGVPHYGGYPVPPKNKEDAYNYMKKYIINKTKTLNNNKRPWISFNGHYPYHHYAAEFGFDKIGSEIGENMESHQMIIAFNRGAARQFGKPWFIDVSAWYGPGILDYNKEYYIKEYGGPTNGHSLEFFRRAYYSSYMAGASRIIAEGGKIYAFYSQPPIYETINNESNNKILKLTPMGELIKNFVNFTIRHSNRGISYAPIGIYIDKYHGTTGFADNFFHLKTFNELTYTKGDYMTFNLLNMIFPGGWYNENKEQCQYVNNEFGDIFDIILQNSPKNILQSYPILIMSGDIFLNNTEAIHLINYVKNGGTLIVNSAYFNTLNKVLEENNYKTKLTLSCSNTPKIIELSNNKTNIKTNINTNSNTNSGKFIVYGPNYSSLFLKPILREISKKIVPFYISTTKPFSIKPIFNFERKSNYNDRQDIQALYNINENGWVLTLINNKGLTKEPHKSIVIDEKERKHVSISLNMELLNSINPGKELNKILDWRTDECLWDKNMYTDNKDFSTLELDLIPGDIKVIEFIFK